jgi:thiosulfate/3-mercaptopyruvate sulfurtransferase
MSNLIQADVLETLLATPSVIIIDTRFNLQDVQAGHRAYDEGHIPGAFYLDLDLDLSGPKADHGGRHPLPDIDALAKKLELIGVSNKSRVVVYDDAANMIAGRFWWLMRYMGHEDTQVLDGGYSSWLAAGYAVSTEVPQPKPAKFKPRLQYQMLVDKDYVKRRMGNPNVVLVDARAPDRYRGENETLDPKAGHIPGAVSKPFVDNLEGKKYKSVDELEKRFSDIFKDKEIIMYCGSGVSANQNLIALEEAGFKRTKLYAGSWSDWVSYPENPVEIGESRK